MSSWRRPCTGRYTDIDRAYGALATYVTLHALADAKAIGFTSGEVYKGLSSRRRPRLPLVKAARLPRYGSCKAGGKPSSVSSLRGGSQANGPRLEGGYSAQGTADLVGSPRPSVTSQCSVITGRSALIAAPAASFSVSGEPMRSR